VNNEIHMLQHFASAGWDQRHETNDRAFMRDAQRMQYSTYADRLVNQS